MYLRARSDDASRLQAGAQINMTDLDALQRFQRIVGCGNITGPRSVAEPHHKPPFMWQTAKRKNVRRVVEMLYPYFCERRRTKADELLAHLRTVT